MSTEDPPVAVCTKCGDITYSAARINAQCGRQPGGRRCKGVYGSALGKDDWAKCGACGGSRLPETGGELPRLSGHRLEFRS
jgi:hypothetical protein